MSISSHRGSFHHTTSRRRVADARYGWRSIERYRWTAASPRRPMPLISRLLAGDQPSAVLECHIGPKPVEQHRHAVAKADQEQHVDAAPEQPGEPAGESNPAEIGDRDLASDRRKVAIVAIAEGRWLLRARRA